MKKTIFALSAIAFITMINASNIRYNIDDSDFVPDYKFGFMPPVEVISKSREMSVYTTDGSPEKVRENREASEIFTYLPDKLFEKIIRFNYKGVKNTSRSYYLYVTGYDHDSKGVETRPHYLKKHPTLRVRYSWDFIIQYTPENVPSFLWRNLLEEFHCRPFHKRPEWHASIKGTNINSFKIDGANCSYEELMDALNNLPRKLESLEIKENQIENNDLKTILDSLKKTSLKKLVLAGNSISGRGFLQIVINCQEIGIETLNLDSNEIKSNGLSQVAKILKDTSIKTLNLSGNRICNSGLFNFAKNLSENAPLEKFIIEDGYRRDGGYRSISPEFDEDGVITALRFPAFAQLDFRR